MTSPGPPLARPLARTAELISQEVGDELVVYDERNQAAHALAPAAAAVWRLCDGTLSPVAIGERLGLEPSVVDAALAQLEDCALLDRPNPLQVLAPSPDPGFDGDRRPELSRRQAAKRFATLGGAALGVSLIYSVTIGPATAAASTCTANGVALPHSASCTATGHSDTYGTVTPTTACCGGGCADNGSTVVCSNKTSGTCVPSGSNTTGGSTTTCCSGSGTCSGTVVGNTCVGTYKCN